MKHIAVLTTDPTIPQNRGAFIQGLRAAGHKVDIVLIGKATSEATRRSLQAGRFPDGYRPDLLLLFCVAYIRVHLLSWLHPILQGFPYVTVWDSNPLRSLYFLDKYRDNHVGLYVLDTQIVEDLRANGFPQASYFPYYYADPKIFRPLTPKEDLRHEVAFAGTYFYPSKQDRLFGGEDRIRWGDSLTAIVEDFKREREATQGYVDVYRFLRERVDCRSREGVELSQHLMYVQKWMEREKLFGALDEAHIDCHVYGGNKATAFRPAGSQRMLPDAKHLHVHPFLDKHKALPQLYNSAAVNLCCTQFPRACHERVFQTAGCGAFILHEWKEDAAALFEPGRELVMYRDPAEVPDLIRHYLKHDGDRLAVAQAAKRRFEAHHQPLHRARQFAGLLAKDWERHQDRAPVGV